MFGFDDMMLMSRKTTSFDSLYGSIQSSSMKSDINDEEKFKFAFCNESFDKLDFNEDDIKCFEDDFSNNII